MLSATASLAAAQISPQYARNMSLYHLHPTSAGARPVNMDTGDVAGDLYFYLDQFLLPLECANASGDFRSEFDCDNPERVDPDLVVSKVDVEVDDRFTMYSACNICNGTDPFTHQPCVKGTYKCDCEGGILCKSARVGMENVSSKFSPKNESQPSARCLQAMNATCWPSRQPFKTCASCMTAHVLHLGMETCKVNDMFSFCAGGGSTHHNWGNECTKDSKPWECWRSNLPRKTGGFWYSTLEQGQCQDGSKAGSCSWRIRATASVRNDCLQDRLMTTAETAAKDCFSACGPRNSTSPCWIACFFDTVLGPEARNSTNVTGLPLESLATAFAGSFEPESQGGCPRVPDEPIKNKAVATIVV